MLVTNCPQDKAAVCPANPKGLKWDMILGNKWKASPTPSKIAIIPNNFAPLTFSNNSRTPNPITTAKYVTSNKLSTITIVIYPFHNPIYM